MIEHVAFPKIPRLNKDIIITKKVKFGIFRNGNILFQIGDNAKCSEAQAEIICILLEKIELGLTSGDYLAWDYV